MPSDFEDVKECNECGKELSAKYQEKYPGRFLCIECVKLGIVQATKTGLDKDAGEKSSSSNERNFGADSASELMSTRNKVAVGSRPRFYPFTDFEAGIMSEHILDLVLNTRGMYWRSHEFLADMMGKLDRYLGQTWFSEKQWKYLLDVMGIVGWPKEFNKAHVAYPSV